MKPSDPSHPSNRAREAIIAGFFSGLKMGDSKGLPDSNLVLHKGTFGYGVTYAYELPKSTGDFVVKGSKERVIEALRFYYPTKG